MKNLLSILSLAFLLTSCTNEYSNFRGCKYKITQYPFSTEIVIIDNYAPIDAYIIILDAIIDNDINNRISIKLSESNKKYLSKEDVLYIRNNATKISSYDSMLSALDKAQCIVNRISNTKE